MFVVQQELNDRVKMALDARFREDILSYEQQYDMMVITVNKKCINEILRFLYDETFLKFQFLTTLCGIHYPESDKPLGVVYHLHSFKNNQRIRIKTFTEINNPVFPTATNIWKTANWMERETFDFFGLVFDGHPNLKRILNTDDFEGFPLRKEFPLEDQTREDKNNSMFGR